MVSDKPFAKSTCPTARATKKMIRRHALRAIFSIVQRLSALMSALGNGTCQFTFVASRRAAHRSAMVRAVTLFPKKDSHEGVKPANLRSLCRSYRLCRGAPLLSQFVALFFLELVRLQSQNGRRHINHVSVSDICGLSWRNAAQLDSRWPMPMFIGLTRRITRHNLPRNFVFDLSAQRASIGFPFPFVAWA